MMMRALILIVTCVACTNVDIYIPIDPDSPLMRARLDAVTCAPEDILEQVPHKILFVIDTSYSNTWTDPVPAGDMPRREQAVRDVIETHQHDENVFFGIITFSDEPRRQTFGFTRDLAILNGAVANVATAQGGTNYSDTLWAVTDFIRYDIERLDEVEASRTRYFVYWLSDGFPTVGVVEPDALTPGVTALSESLEGNVAEFRFDTAFLGGGAPPGGGTMDDTEAKDLLRDMATEGDGTFTDIPDGEDFAFDVETTPLVRSFVLETFVVFNRNARMGDEFPLVDSDGDGLIDAVEADLDLEPRDADSDGDGVRDGAEVSLTPATDPFAWDGTLCPTFDLDSDGDGLHDCEELLLDTRRDNVDTDGDGLLDGIEIALGSSPVDGDAHADSDLDGMSDGHEVRANLDPRTFTSREDAERWSYVYTLTPMDDETETACTHVQVGNLSGYQTKPSAGRPTGTNIFEAVAVYEPLDGIGDRLYMRAIIETRFRFPDLREPANGVLDLDPADFVAILPASDAP